MMRNPFSRISPGVLQAIRVAVRPGVSYTRPGGGQTAGGINGDGEWVGWSMLDVDSVDEPEPGFILSDQTGEDNARP